MSVKGSPYKTITDEDIKALREAEFMSTDVVAWYPHSHEVRGPFGRWLTVSEVDSSNKSHVADTFEDAKFAAAAMNALPHLLDLVESLKHKVQELEAKLAIEKMLGVEHE